ncbi:hypothetical protein CWB58_16110 [Pseudoalteromonas sp. S201]|nr:hypothetical protein CWB81_09255 [Pseudoalteromonas sp. S1688]TMS92120.1 hypothetical protein CWB58_16110 [Pseudoalteromonas sp. S201]
MLTAESQNLKATFLTVICLNHLDCASGSKLLAYTKLKHRVCIKRGVFFILELTTGRSITN